MILGGGFALAEITERSGLSTVMAEYLSLLSVFPPAVIVFLVCIITAVLSELASNTATITIIMPVLHEMVSSNIF